MAVWLLLLLEPWTVLTGQAVLKRLHSYDLEAITAEATPGPGGLAVTARLRVRPRRPGPLRLLISSHVTALTAARADGPVIAETGLGGIEAVATRFAAPGADIPTLLTLRAPRKPWRVGEVLTVELRYRWTPPAAGWTYAGPRGVQTHLSGFWLPAMAGERFDLDLLVRTDLPTAAPGVRSRERDGWRFRSTEPVPLAPVVVGTFDVTTRQTTGRRLEVWSPAGARGIDPAALLDDMAAVFARLHEWLGAPGIETFRLVIDPRARPMPAYCGRDFAVVQRAHLPEARGRARWLELLAHECSHVWWGYRLQTPLLGGGRDLDARRACTVVRRRDRG